MRSATRLLTPVLVVALTALHARAAAQVPADAAERRAELTAELDALSLDLPIGLRMTGGLLVGGSAFAALCMAIFVPMERSFDLGAEPAAHDDTALHASIVALGVTFGMGLAFLIPGVVMESEREAQRRRVQRELDYVDGVVLGNGTLRPVP